MKKYKEPTMKIDTYSKEVVATTLSSMFQSWGEESPQRVTGTVDWSTSRASNMSF